MLGFVLVISVFRTGWRFARVCVGNRNMQPFVVNGGLMRVRFSVTPSMAVSMREN